MNRQTVLERFKNTLKPKTAEIRPFFNVVAETAESPAEVVLFGDVVSDRPRDFWTDEPVEGAYIVLDEVMEKLKEVENATNINIRLNSSGGDLFAGIAIHNLLRGFVGKKTVIVEGLAASAASAIMCAADTIKVHPSSMIMIHNVASCLCGFYSTPEIRDLLRDHEACELSLKRLYAERTGKSEEELQEMLDATTWMIGQDAIDNGFADEMIETDSDDLFEATLTNDGQYMMVAGVRHSISNLGSLPSFINGGNIKAEPDEVIAEVQDGVLAVERKEDALDIQNAADLSREYPEFVNELVNAAVMAERERIRAIEDIENSIGNAELVNEAKFTNAMTAAELALASMKAENEVRKQFLNDCAEDDKESKVDEIDPEPAEDEDEEETEEMTANALITEAVNLFNQMKGMK